MTDTIKISRDELQRIAQGQQVECQECERLRGDFEELAERYGKLQAGEDSLLVKVVTERDHLRAELSALKAQQVGQEPVAIANKGDHAFWVKWTDAGKDLRGPGIKLYTAPQPAPAQDVAGLLEWAVDRWHVEVANRPLQNVHRRSLDDTWRQVIRKLGGDAGLLCGPAHDALAAHDKQSGEKKS